MSKLVITLVLIFSALIAGVALSLDNSPRPTPAQDDAAYLEWQEMDPVAREMACGLFEDHGDRIFNENLGPGMIRAKSDLMERECP